MYIVEIGHYALILGGGIAGAQMIAGYLYRRVVNDSFFVLSWAQLFFVFSAFGALLYAHVVSDFSVLNVWQHSHTTKPLLYKIVGVWGNHEGSMLLWVLWLSVFSAALGLNRQRLPDTYYRLTMGILGFLSFGFILFVLVSANPFERIWPIPLNGMDLNPLLQDPGLSFHPPLLYGGYVGFAITFAMTWAALYQPAVGWARYIRPWALLAWGILTLGITSGSWWAYYELGWGGWWFWDPVENASLLPWLAGLALIHSLKAQETVGALKLWSLVLGLWAFTCSILGAFLVRSGVLSSVHTFAVDPDRGLFLLGFMAFTFLPPMLLFARRAFYIGEGTRFHIASRESGLMLQNIFVMLGLFVIAYGTLYPLIAQGIFQKHLTIGDVYYRGLLLPLLVPFAFAMGVTPFLMWGQGNSQKIFRGFFMLVLMLGCVYGISYCYGQRLSVTALLSLSAGIWVFAASLYLVWRQIKRSHFFKDLGMLLSHVGVGVFLISMAINTTWREERLFTMVLGEKIFFAPYTIKLGQMQRIPGQNYISNRAIFDIEGAGSDVQLKPERRFYYVQKTAMTESAIYTNGFCNLYITIGDTQNNTHWPVRIHMDPMAPGIWIGGVMIGLGALWLGLQLLLKRRRRNED